MQEVRWVPYPKAAWNRHFRVVRGGAKRGMKQKTLYSQNNRSAVFALKPSFLLLFVVCGGEKRGKKEKNALFSDHFWLAVFRVETIIFVLFVAALREARRIKRWIPRACGRRFLRADPAPFLVVDGGAKRGKK